VLLSSAPVVVVSGAVRRGGSQIPSRATDAMVIVVAVADMSAK